MLRLGASIPARLTAIRLVLRREIEDSFIRLISRTFSSVSLPNVLELHIDCGIDFGRKCTTLCNDWDMPSLRELEAINVLPNLPLAVASKIRSCCLVTNKGIIKNVEWRWSASELIGFLESLTVLSGADGNDPHIGSGCGSWCSELFVVVLILVLEVHIKTTDEQSKLVRVGVNLRSTNNYTK